MFEVYYEFKIDDKVITPFGTIGVISMLGYDDGGNQYYVKHSTASDWFKEAMLTRP